MNKSCFILLSFFLATAVILSGYTSTAPATAAQPSTQVGPTQAASQSTPHPPTGGSGGYPPPGSPPSGVPSGGNSPSGNPPSGGTPGGNPPSGSASGGVSGSASDSVPIRAAYTVEGTKPLRTTSPSRPPSRMNSAIYVKETGKLTVYGASIQGSGNTTSTDDSSFYDLNAAVLAGSSSTIHLASSTVASSGTGANGVFSTGGGTITVQGGLVKTSRQDSAGIYSTGTIIMTDTTFISSGAEAAVLEGGNSITLNHDSLTSTKADKGG